MHLVPFSSLCYTNLTEPRQFLRLFLDLSPIVLSVTRQYMEIHGITRYDSLVLIPSTRIGFERTQVMEFINLWNHSRIVNQMIEYSRLHEYLISFLLFLRY